MTLRRAGWIERMGAGETFSSVIQACLELLPNSNDTAWERLDGAILQINHRQVQENSVWLHITMHTPDEDTSIVQRNADTVTSEIEALSPPDGYDYVDGSAMLRITDDNIIICCNIIRESTVSNYLREVIAMCNQPRRFCMFDILAVADYNTTDLLHREGVKTVTLSKSLYNETIENIRATHQTASIVDRALLGLANFFSLENTPEQLREVENLQARVSFTYDGRANGDLTAAQLQRFAEEVVENEDNEFEIVTRKDTKITPTALSVRKFVSFNGEGNTIPHTDAWTRINEYWRELEATGALEH